ncbi:hypothetical protein AA0473_0835 [Acetobacter orleanensis NRIC 0473]|uniref:Schlafen group 3-like DNA/RNA helicase domain-containing protein n=1 Tax=Acetobacter orleanensis TaxID=104099 RepID=A0A4Y3TNG1_9PROT|nr:DUF2075 domain-containing protein [Acetobacter orleanensis]KXV62391.1 DNA replication initiation protein [Acetobacter orleanensis]GAN67630.1 hypothetical protein Abol_009_076 [Acetobacter orleanensis JCM 7639]GBR25203.1 hypothetical protein AA0473_0835 [Acetobacter orleanensis NRIC 0473]GEB82510.1 hypothetical protein AOR01nite_09870 [Acetobacter orleanensis]
MKETGLSDHYENDAAEKLSPEKRLSPEQQNLKNAIKAFCITHQQDTHAVFVIEGDAGTGKSIVINSIFNEIQALSRGADKNSPFWKTDNSLVVNHPEMMKLYKNISESYPALKKKDFERPTTFINRMHKVGKTADILFVDEAHLLLIKSDKYNRFEQNNHLEELIKLSRITVLVFDEKQVLKFKSCWSKSLLNSLLKDIPCQTYHLRTQFRMQAGQDVLDWIEGFCHKTILPMPHKQAFDFRFFADAQDLYDAIQKENSRHGLSRMVATYDYPYRLDGQDHFIHEGRFTLRWDRSKPDEKLPWAERPDTIDEVGSVYTVQGFDLNYVGLILGPSVLYDPVTDGIRIDTNLYEDGAAFAGRDGIQDPDGTKERIMLNAINVLMTRAVHGLFIYASDPALRERLMQAQTSSTQARESV